MENKHSFIDYSHNTLTADEMASRSRDFQTFMRQRRTIREFSDTPVDVAVIEHLISAAASAPSGAHKQPWHFCAVHDPGLKASIRKAAEKEEYENYHGRMSPQWLKDLEPFETNWNKPFLEIAPWLIIVFKKVYDLEGRERKNNYYVNESVGIAVGILLAAIHNAGLAALTHTPSPMNFLGKILGRPANERPYLLIPVGLPARNTKVPDLSRKPLEEVMTVY